MQWDAPIDIEAGLAFLSALNAASPFREKEEPHAERLFIVDDAEEVTSSDGPEPLTFSEETGHQILVNDRRAPGGDAWLTAIQSVFVATNLCIDGSSIGAAAATAAAPAQLRASPQVVPQIFASAALWGKKKRVHRRTGVSFSNLLYPSEVVHKAIGVSVTEARAARFRIGLNPAPPTKRAREPMNESFKNEHPWLHRSMTFSKLKNLKWDLFALTDSVPALDPTTVAMAWVYFERLVVLRVVRKTNRKRLVAACLVLAFKFHQALQHHRLRDLLEAIRSLDKQDCLTPREIYSVEFSVFALVGFELRLAFSDVAPHLREYYVKRPRRDFTSDYGAPLEEYE